MTSSTVSSESAPRSSMNLASGVTWSGFTPNCSTMISLTLCSIVFSAMMVLRFFGSFAVCLCHDSKGVKSRFKDFLHHHSPVHGKHLTRNIPCSRTGQKQGRARNILCLPKAVQRNFLEYLRLHLRA